MNSFTGFKDISYNDISGLFWIWDRCQLMTMPFSDIISKLNYHFNITPDEDIIFVSQTNYAPHSNTLFETKIKTETTSIHQDVKMSFEQLLEESGK